MNLPGVLAIVLSISQDFRTDKKTKVKASKIYLLATKYENLFLAFALSDLLILCAKVCKLFQ